MFFFDLMDIFGWVSEVTVGWSWDAVERGVYAWVAESAVASVEFVYVTLSEQTSPDLGSAMYQRAVLWPIFRAALWCGSVAAGLQVIRVVISNRAELIGPTLVRAGQLGLYVGGGTWFVGTAVEAGDALSALLWSTAGPSVELLLEAYIASMVDEGSTLLGTLLGVLLGLLVLVGTFASLAALLVRNVLVYLVAAYGAFPVAFAVEESNRGYLRELVQTVVALALAPSVMVTSLAISSVAVMNQYGTGSAGEPRLSALGLLMSSLSLAMTGFVPGLLYRFLPALAQASGVTGVVGGIGRSTAGLAQSALLGASLGSAASRMVSAVSNAGGSTPPSSSSGGGSGGPGGSGGGSKASSVLVATNPMTGPGGSGAGPSGAGFGGPAGGSLATSVGRR